MKSTHIGILFFLGILVFCTASGMAEEADSSDKEVSYAFGMLIATDLMDTGLRFDYDSFMQGFREIMEKEETRYTMPEAIEMINLAFEAAQAEMGERNRIQGAAFLAENSKRPEVTVTPSGLQYEVISEGQGEHPGPADFVLVHYRGTTIDGEEFDTTHESGRPVEIPLDRVIPGWSEGLRMMKEGGKAKLYIPPDLAYGNGGGGSSIGPGSVLIFDVELLAILRVDSGAEEEYPEEE